MGLRTHTSKLSVCTYKSSLKSSWKLRLKTKFILVQRQVQSMQILPILKVPCWTTIVTNDRSVSYFDFLLHIHCGHNNLADTCFTLKPEFSMAMKIN